MLIVTRISATQLQVRTVCNVQVHTCIPYENGFCVDDASKKRNEHSEQKLHTHIRRGDKKASTVESRTPTVNRFVRALKLF